MDKVISLYDLTGIQSYIFGSNVMRENLGGSWLVEHALDKRLEDACHGLGDLLWHGGGNAMVRASATNAVAIATRLSVALCETSPGLEVACVHEPENGEFRVVYGRAQHNLARVKAARWPGAFFDGGGVTAACHSTSEPAVDADEDGLPVGPIALARAEAAGAAEGRLREFVDLNPNPLDKPLKYTSHIDHLGRTRGERSFVGVIHFDGNGMGSKFLEAAKQGEEALIDLSRKVQDAGAQAFKDAMLWVVAHLKGITDPDRGGFLLWPEGDALCFPVRPIVYGGDDMTLVCDGRLALDFAAQLLKAWTDRTATLLGEPAQACAGVALVKSRYPFYRAYQLADDCVKSAKKRLSTDGLSSKASAIEWVMVDGGGVESLSRRREHHGKARDEKSLSAAPYLLSTAIPASEAHRDWNWFRETLVNALQEDEAFHTQYKRLAGVLYEGVEPTREHLERWRERFGKRLPEPPGGLISGGFAASDTPYLDALELIDRILPMKCYETVKSREEVSA